MQEVNAAVATFWGDRLVRWPADTLAGLPLRGDDASYLIDVGLPSDRGWGLVLAIPPRGERARFENGRLVLLRDQGIVPICLVAATGRIIAIEDDRERSVSSTLGQYGAFLMYFERYRQRVVNCVEESAQLQLVDVAEREMQALDPDAMCDREAYWSVVIEQMRDGLL